MEIFDLCESIAQRYVFELANEETLYQMQINASLALKAEPMYFNKTLVEDMDVFFIEKDGDGKVDIGFQLKSSGKSIGEIKCLFADGRGFVDKKSSHATIFPEGNE